MPRGSAPGEYRGGRSKGRLNKKTIATLEREDIKRQVLDEIRKANAAESEAAKHRAKDVMEEFLPIVRGIAAYYHPTFEGMPQQNLHGNEAKFMEWFPVLLDLAKALAPFQSPTFKAIAVHMPTEPIPAEKTIDADGNITKIGNPARVYEMMVKAGHKAA